VQLFKSVMYLAACICRRLCCYKVEDKLEKDEEASGPTPWLITGNLLQLGEDPRIILTKSGERYGDMFQTKLGSMTVVVLCGTVTFKQAIEIQGEISVGRSGLNSLTENEERMIFSKEYREGCHINKDCKKYPQKAVIERDKNLTCSCLLQEQTQFRVSEVMRAFRELSETTGSFGLERFFTRCLASVICNLCFGKRYNQNDGEFLTVLQVSHNVIVLGPP
uniref:Uncharacterized protein n=1 Tax=Strix occidentalis caurina TaxID=311401 RepID=A0A8D0F3I8_STROC